MRFTADSVRDSLQCRWDKYFAKLAAGQSPTWKCDDRAALLFCLSQWLMDELTSMGSEPWHLSDDDRRTQQRFFNRKSRATDDLYELAALTMNMALEGNIDQYKGRG